MTAIRCFLLWCIPLVASAGADLAPVNGAASVQVAETGKEAQNFYPVNPGSHLDFSFTGPGRVWVYVRSGARPSGPWGYPHKMEMPLEFLSTRIDGVPLAPALSGSGMLMDTESTYPWLSKGILLDVPEGSDRFRLAARLDGPPLLVRVVVPGAATQPAIAAAAEEEADLPEESPVKEEASNEEEETVAEIIDAVPEEPVAQEPVGEESFGGLYEIFDEEAQTLDPQALPVEEEEVVDLSKEEEPEAVELGDFANRLGHSFKGTRLSIGTGIGAPMQGNQIIASAQLSARIELFPILSDAWAPGWGRLDLALSTGWYRVGVNQTLVVPDAIAGSAEVEVTYATHVVPITLGLHYDIPLRIGPAMPFVAVGGGLIVAQRTGESPGSAIAGGWMTSAGALIDAGPVQIVPSLVFNGAKAALGRKDSDGADVAENLSNFRLDLAVQTHF
jgi:hypothetical protein